MSGIGSPRLESWYSRAMRVVIEGVGELLPVCGVHIHHFNH